ncbi:nipped-B-like protein B isoform X2 [Astyanax mexicanus]|uniref:nipped-B-like protein B isoform X2 n=1 Tax=Astyanax mexicanus TaxID=7994 RepID=UPI0020CAA8BC|nr:nipped-B-like protein B isoform X2 [Astyanax mexicanus]
MNGDMPHVPITTLAGIASLTDLLNQLPLPSPLPATTTKSLLYNGRIAEEVNCLLARRDDNLVSQLAHSLNQVSTEHIELKDNLGSDDPEGDMPVLLQTVLTRNPNIFREKSIMQQPMMPPYKMSHNSMHGSPASTNYQQTTVTPSPPSRFVQPQTGSGARFMPQQNSPVPSPYAPQSPAGYMQYPHPPSYSQHQQIQQVSVASPMVPGGIRNIHDSKVSGQMSSNSANHNARHCSNEEYMNIVHRLGSEESDPSMRNASFPLRSPQSVCSPAGSEGTPKVGSRPPLILQSPPPYTSPRDAAPDLLMDSPDRKKKQKKMIKEEGDKGAMYDIVSSPSKDSTKLTLKLSRVKSSETDQSTDLMPSVEHGSDAENELPCNSLPYPRNPQERLAAGQCPPEQSGYQQVPVLQNTGTVTAKQPGGVSGTPYDEAEMDALAEIERIERESAIERERGSKEVQDKDKPLKKRKQDSYPQEPGAGGTAGATGGPGVGGGGSAGNKLAPQEASAASNGTNRPALMVSIDLQQAGRAEGQLDSCPTPALEAQRWPEDGSDSAGVLRLKSKTDGEAQRAVDGRPEVIKQRAETPQKTASEGRPETPKHKHDSRRDSTSKTQGSDKRSDASKHRHDGKPEKVRSEGRGTDTPRKHESRSEVSRDSHREEKHKDRERNKDRDREKDKDKDRDRERDKDKEKEKEKDKEKDKEKEKEKDRDNDAVKVRRPDTPKGKVEHDRHGRDKERDRENRDRGNRDRENRDRDRENRERKHRTESKEHKEKRSPEQRSRPDSPRVKQENKQRSDRSERSERSDRLERSDHTDRSERSERSDRTDRSERSERSDLKSSNNKEEKRSSDGNRHRSDDSKQSSTDSKAAEFPDYLLGVKSGALKNFVIPKLKRDKDGNVPPAATAPTSAATPAEIPRPESWGQPRVKLERLGLVENISKRPKPVVVLQKLSYDEVQKIIKERHSRSSKSSKNRSSFGKSSKGGIDESVLKELPPHLLAEIESTMPLCERVKMNKRKRSTVNEKPKYAEVSSGEDSASVESAPKRSKKDRDRTWECEEKDRKGERRRSGGHHDGRRGSGSRYRDQSSDDSDEGTPPPSMSEIARKMKMKEKQKKRKAYEPKLTPEEMMDSSTFKRFTASVDNILENLEDVDLSLDDDEIPQELLLGKHQLSELGSESAKIKAMGITYRISSEKLVKVLGILEKNIQDGSKLSTLMNHGNDAEDEERLWRDLIMERVTKSADACLTALNIMTSTRMPKAVYIEDVIERVLQYTKFHLQNTLYPQYDPVYRVGPHGGGMLSSKAKRAKCSTHKQRVIVMLYNKVCDIVSNISELLEIQLLTDTTILQVSSMGITPFFVENVSELQLCAIKLVTAVFSRYEKHRQLILEEIFTSLARLPTSKRSLRNFRLNSSDVDGEPMYIQMVTALVLQLIQCVVHLPNDKDNTDDEYDKKVDQDVLITNSYETAMRTAQNFLSVFLKKCGSKQGEEDYRPLFENFVQDLLSTVNKPEWPAAELLLSLLGRLLVHQFSNKQTEMALRVASLDYLGTVAARLRKDAVTSKMDQRSIDRILKETPGNDETQQLQKALLDYLNENIDTDPSLVFSRKFYIAQWFRDSTTETEKAMKSQNQKDDDSSEGQHHTKDVETTGEIMQRAEARKKFLRSIIKTTPSQFTTLKMNSDTVDYDDACLVVRYLASMRPFAQSFDIYLTQILRVLGESAIAVRTKAMKCLSEVVAVDPSILARLDMQRGVHGRLMDNSTSVREAAVELVGRFVLSRPQLTEQYYDMLIERILDTGISVRKRVIKILRDICLEQPTFNKITEMCVKMIRRVNDEEGIKKLVNETFQKLWFTPTPNHDKEAMTRKILNITDVVSACKDSGYDWFEQLLQNLLKTEEDASYKPARKACAQLVDNLVEHILKYEEAPDDCENKGGNSNRLVSCITTLYLFSKNRAQLMVKHAMTMQPYLTTKCNNQNDFMVICNVAKILELVVPLMDHPSETFLTTIEEDLMKLIIKYGMTVVQHCVSCLGAVVNKVTHNYKFVWACFNRYYGALNKLKTQHQEDSNSTVLVSNKPALLRSLFTVGALCRHFDFDLEDFKGNNKVVIKDKVLELLLYFTKNEDEEVQSKAIIGLGFLFIQHPGLMFVPEVKTLYNGLLSDRKTSVNLKIQVLKNLQTYLQEEDTRMQEADREWKKLSKQEDLKEMGDISSGMSSSIMQLYLKQVLEAFFHTQSSVRHFALNVIALTLNQGLIHPVQCVPYLIAMGTDPEPTMRNKADQQLVEIDKKYTGFIHMKAVAGMKMSYQVQQAIMASKDTIIRGFRQDENSSALCSHLFTMVRGNRQHRRAFLISLLNLFDDSAKTEVNMLLFIADNLACFPFQSQEEPLFIMHHIDITLSVSGSNLLQSFKESLLKEPRPREKKRKKKVREKKYSSDEEDEDESSSSSSSSSDEDEVVHRAKRPKRAAANVDSDSDLDVEDVEKVMDRLPDNPLPLLDFANASQGILLLLVLKQHLKNLYGFSDSKIQKYSPTESAKVYDKAVNRKNNVHFNPRQTLEFLANGLSNAELTDDIKRKIVKQYLDFKVLMEHLDPDEEDEEGEASASTHARNKAITALLGGSSPKNNAADSYDEESDGEEKAPGASRRSRRGGDSADASGHLNETVEAMDVIAICCPKYKDRPQIARVIQKTSNGYSVHWMAGSYSGTWAEAKKRDGRKLVPWVDTIKESDIIYKKIALTSAHKLTNKMVQTLRSLYAAKEGTSS